MSVYPSSIATNSDLYVALDNFATTLNGAINNSQTTITLISTAGLPTVGILTIESEKIKYTGISGNDITGCTRGFSSTSAAAHADGSTAQFNVVEEHHNGLKDEIIAIQTELGANSSNLVHSTGTETIAGSKTFSSGVAFSSTTASTVPYLDASKILVSSSITPTELGYLSGLTSSVQTQLNTKAADASVVHLAGTETVTGTKTLSSFSGTLAADLAANSFKITGLAAGTTNGDSLRYEQVIGVYALDSAVVHNTGTETVAGVKTFSSAPVLSSNAASTPTAGSLNRDAAGGLSWAYVSQSGGTFSLVQDVNVASLSDDGVGLFTLTWATAYSGNDQYSVTLGHKSGLVRLSGAGTNPASGSVQILTTDFADNPADRNSITMVTACGKQ